MGIVTKNKNTSLRSARRAASFYRYFEQSILPIDIVKREKRKAVDNAAAAGYPVNVEACILLARNLQDI